MSVCMCICDNHINVTYIMLQRTLKQTIAFLFIFGNLSAC